MPLNRRTEPASYPVQMAHENDAYLWSLKPSYLWSLKPSYLWSLKPSRGVLREWEVAGA
jgi:hypothetical protein